MYSLAINVVKYLEPRALQPQEIPLHKRFSVIIRARYYFKLIQRVERADSLGMAGGLG